MHLSIGHLKCEVYKDDFICAMLTIRIDFDKNLESYFSFN